MSSLIFILADATMAAAGVFSAVGMAKLVRKSIMKGVPRRRASDPPARRQRTQAPI